jgi:hypothetical protein
MQAIGGIHFLVLAFVRAIVLFLLILCGPTSRLWPHHSIAVQNVLPLKIQAR